MSLLPPAPGLSVPSKITLSIGLALSIGLIFSAGARSQEGANAVASAGQEIKSADKWSDNYSSGLNALDAQQPSQAEAYFRKALQEMAEQAHKPEDQELCMRKLGDALLLRGQIGQAQKTFQQLHDLLAKRYGVNSPKLAPPLMMLGSIQESLGNHSQAMAFYNKALKLNEKHYGSYSPQFAGNLRKLELSRGRSGGSPYAPRSTNLASEPGLAAAAQMRSGLKPYKDLITQDDDSNRQLIEDFDKEILGETAPIGGQSTIGVLPPSDANLTSSWQKESAFKLRAQSQASVDTDPQVFLRGLDRPTSEQNLAPVFKTMSETIFQQSHFEKGEEFYKRKIAADIQSLGPEHPSVANDLCGLAVFYMARQNYSQARPLLSRALPIYEKAWGNNNLLTINCRTSLGTAEFHLGNNEAAAHLYRQALSSGQSALGPNNIATARVLNDLAYLYFHQGKLAEACTFYEWALASTEGAVGQKDPLVAACLKDYAQVLRGLGRAEEAGAVESRAETILAHAQ